MKGGLKKKRLKNWSKVYIRKKLDPQNPLSIPTKDSSFIFWSNWDTFLEKKKALALETIGIAEGWGVNFNENEDWVSMY